MLFTNFKSKQNPHYTRGIAPQRVTSDGPIFAAWRLGNTAPTKSRSGGEPLLLATLRRAVGDLASSRWRHCVLLDRPEIERQNYRADLDSDVCIVYSIMSALQVHLVCIL